MLFLPAAALCCLGSALAAMAVQLIQKDLTLTRKPGEGIPIGCTGFEICDSNFVYWYQKKKSEPLMAILRFDRSGSKRTSTFDHPQKESFTAMRRDNMVELVINNAIEAHSATYYCVCHKTGSGGSGGSGESNNYLIFGTGTKLYVTASQVTKPEVSLYSAEPQQGKQPLLCVASGMFPPEIRFSWRRKKEQGTEEELPSTDGGQLELSESGRVSSIRVVDLDPLHTYTYTCSVKHEQVVSKQPSQVVRSGPPPPPPRQTAPPSEPRWYRERLVCLLYSALIAKSLLYFCGLSLFSICGTKRASYDD